MQTISFLGYLKHIRGVSGPHMVVCPKSTLGNWVNEFAKWCPSLSVFKFHGNKEERVCFVSFYVLLVVPLDEIREKSAYAVFLSYTQLKSFCLKAEMRQNKLRAGKFDVCLTTYEIAMKEKGALSKFSWR